MPTKIMMRSALILVVISAFSKLSDVTAFAPKGDSRFTSTALNAIDPRKEIGVQAPIGFFEYVNVSIML
jgi:hypothetical protein